MATPTFLPPVIMQALVPLKQWTQAGPRPPVPVGGYFWARGGDVANLVGSGSAVIAPPNVTIPPNPPYTAAGVPGLGAGTSNSSPA